MQLLLFFLSVLVHISSCENVFRFGAVLSADGPPETNMEEAKNGYEIYIDVVNGLNRGRGFFLQGKRGTTGFYFKYDLLWRDDSNDATLHAERVTELIEEDNVHFLGGSRAEFAEEEMEMANAGGVLNYHCCVAPDAYYKNALPTVFGISASNAQYTNDYISALFLVGTEETAFLYDEEDLFTKTTCEEAEAYFQSSKNPFGHAEMVMSRTFNRSTLTPDFFSGLAEETKSLGVQAMIACVRPEEGKDLVNALHEAKYSLKSLFVTEGPTKQDWVDSFKPGFRADAILSADTWHPQLQYPDDFFGSSRRFAALYRERFGKIPSCNGAAAAAVGLTLTQAIRNAFKQCDISETEGDVEALLYDRRAIQCDDDLGRRGYDRVLAALSLLEMDTFFGHVKFNPYGRNIGTTPVTTQVFQRRADNGAVYREIEAVMPVSFASDLPVYPARNHYKEECSPGFYASADEFDRCKPCRKGEVSYAMNSAHCDSCPIGQWMDEKGGSACHECPEGTVTEVRGATSKMDCRCRPGFFNAAQQMGVECEKCPEGAECPGGTELPIPLFGYWANETRRTYIYECDPASVCEGGPSVTCAEGHAGRLCAQCDDTHFSTIRGCYTCFHPVGIMALAVALLGLWYFINVTISRSVSSLEMILGWAQLANIIGDVNLNWTKRVTVTFGVANILDFDVDVLEPSCFMRWGFKQNFTIQLLLPFVMSMMGFIGFLGSSIAYYMVKNEWLKTEGKRNLLMSLFVVVPEDKQELRKKWDATIATFLSSVDVTYVTIAKYCFDIFKCENIAGVSVLREDPSVDCGDAQHRDLVVLSIFGIVFYVIGYPLYIFWTLFSLKRNQSFSKAINIRRFGFVYEKFELEYYFTPAIIIIRKFLFVLVLVFMNNPAFQVGTLAVIITASLMIHVYTAPYVDTYLDVLFSFLLIALMFEAFGGLMFYSDNLPHANRRILEWLVIGTLILMTVVFVVILVMEVIRIYHIRYVRKAHKNYLRHGLEPRAKTCPLSRASISDNWSKLLEGHDEALDVSMELLDTFQPGFVYKCIKNCPDFVEKWDRMTAMLKDFMCDQSETSYLSLDPIAKFWRKLVANFPELTDFLAVADDSTRAKFNDVATNLYRNFYLTNKVSPLPLMKILNWRDYAPMAQWLAIAPADDREFFITCILQMFRITGNEEAADILESKLENGGHDPDFERRLSGDPIRSNHARMILSRINDGSHPFRHSASLPSLNTATAASLGISRFSAGPSKMSKSGKSSCTTPIEEDVEEEESLGTACESAGLDLKAECSLPNNEESFSSKTSGSYKTALSDPQHNDDTSDSKS